MRTAIATFHAFFQKDVFVSITTSHMCGKSPPLFSHQVKKLISGSTFNGDNV